MAVITISRQYGSGGDDIAAHLCVLLGYQYFDKSLIIQAAQESGLSEQEIIDFSEENRKVGSFFERLFNRAPAAQPARVWKADPSGIRTAEESDLSEEAALTLVQKAIASGYTTGNLVIVGRGGQVILRDMPGVLHVRIICPMEDRIQRVKEQLRPTVQVYTADIETRRHAQDRILDRDAASADYLKRFYNVDWDDPELYHVVINTGKMDIAQAAHCLARLAEVFDDQNAPKPAA